MKERIHDYEKKLESIRDQIMRVSPEKWIGDEDDDSECSGDINFDEGDLTPIKGSVGKMDRKRIIFDMLRAFNSIL